MISLYIFSMQPLDQQASKSTIFEFLMLYHRLDFVWLQNRMHRIILVISGGSSLLGLAETYQCCLDTLVQKVCIIYSKKKFLRGQRKNIFTSIFHFSFQTNEKDTYLLLNKTEESPYIEENVFIRLATRKLRECFLFSVVSNSTYVHPFFLKKYILNNYNIFKSF